MAVTKEQALFANVFHFAPRGATACSIRRVERWRRNGRTQTWKRSPERFSVPVKFGLWGYSHITELNAEDFHVVSECPIYEQRER